MKFEHRTPVIYYSSMEDIKAEIENIEIETIQKRFPEYNILNSRKMFDNEEEWSDRINSIIETVDVIIFSCINECKEGFLLSEKYDLELNIAIKNKKVICVISRNKIKLISNSNWVNTAIQTIKQRR